MDCIYIEGENLTDRAALELGEVLKESKVIKAVSIQSNPITDEGCAHIFEALKLASNLTSLRLSNDLLFVDYMTFL